MRPFEARSIAVALAIGAGFYGLALVFWVGVEPYYGRLMLDLDARLFAWFYGFERFSFEFLPGQPDSYWRIHFFSHPVKMPDGFLGQFAFYHNAPATLSSYTYNTPLSLGLIAVFSWWFRQYRAGPVLAVLGLLFALHLITGLVWMIAATAKVALSDPGYALYFQNYFFSYTFFGNLSRLLLRVISALEPFWVVFIYLFSIRLRPRQSLIGRKR